jgi:hypothetical protein
MGLKPGIVSNSDSKMKGFSRPLVLCRELPAFDASNLNAVRAAFQNSDASIFQQAWLPKQEIDFTPGIVRTGWRENSLLFFAEFIDADIFTNAIDHHQRFWELGDTFEIFLRPVEKESYSEFHVTPNNRRLHLGFPNAVAAEHARKTGSLENVLVHQKKFTSRTWVQSEARRWFAFVEIAVSSVSKELNDLPGSRWLFSFSRYDYTRGHKEPVISSTSAHTVPDFHRQGEWGELLFTNGSRRRM